ncbi:MAG: hypothetical protein A2X23_05015 [Chloroflexi bacterium GWC2_73_18]|nr:MAG: hypothetical protein A2X23_05015 [Chloroflexi bacterium GWC2_73_18]
MMGFEWGMGVGGWLWMLVGIGVVVAIVWALVTAATGHGRPATADAASILKARFARGEISEEEYEQARRVLGI